VLIGVGHAACTFVLFPGAASALVTRGIVGAISVESPAELVAAFWFALFAPALVWIGWLVSHALARDDRRLLALIGRVLVGISVVGVVVMPVSGFWAVLAVGWLTTSRVASPQPCKAVEPTLRA